MGWGSKHHHYYGDHCHGSDGDGGDGDGDGDDGDGPSVKLELPGGDDKPFTFQHALSHPFTF